MRRRLNLLALAVICGAGGLLAAPAPLQATYRPRAFLVESCCMATGPYGVIYRCCSETGCVVTAAGCSRL